MTSVCVFVGPTLPLEVATRELPEATFLPPARCGDVARLIAEQRPTVIGLIDGLFDSVPSVWHKELLYALSKGVRVFGASSMGALRATELSPYGMEGVGRIFEAYRSGEWDADDEVAVVHGPPETGFRASSVALANIRLGLDDAQAAGVISASTAAILVQHAQAQFYADRSWETVLASANEYDIPHEQYTALRAYLADALPDAKREDALTLLRSLREMLKEPVQPHRPTFDFEPTAYWKQLVMHTTSLGDFGHEGGVSGPALRRHVRVQPQGMEWLRGAVLLRFLLADARRRDIDPDATAVQVAVDRFRRVHGLLSETQTRTWLARHQITEKDLELMALLEMSLEDVLRDAGGSIDGLLSLELKRRGLFGDVTEAIMAKKRKLQQLGVESLTLEDVGIRLGDLVAWHQTQLGSIDGGLADHAQWLGFESVRELLTELLLEYDLQTHEKTASSDAGEPTAFKVRSGPPSAEGLPQAPPRAPRPVGA